MIVERTYCHPTFYPFFLLSLFQVFLEAESAFVVGPWVVFVSEPQASVDIAVAFAVLVPVSEVAVEVDSSGRPTFFAFPNID